MSELTPIEGVVVNESNDPHGSGNVYEQANLRAAVWLHGFDKPTTRNAYARAIGLSADVFSTLSGAPKRPREPSPLSWIPWAIGEGIEPYGDLGPLEVQSWVHACSEFKPRVRQQWFSALCSFYRAMRSHGVTSCNPSELINRKTMGIGGRSASRTKALTTGQVRALYLAAHLDSVDRERSRAIVAVLAATGCRAAELATLNDTSYRRSHPSGPADLLIEGKGDKQRWQKLPAADADLVEAYMASRPGPQVSKDVALPGQVSAGSDRPLFRSRDGHRINPDVLIPLLRRLAKLPQPDDPSSQTRTAEQNLRGIRDTISPHQFRHAYAVTAARHGVPVTQIQRDLGHDSLETTQIYLTAASDIDESAAQVVSDIYHAGESLYLPGMDMSSDE